VNSLISLSLINCSIKCINDNQFYDWPKLKLVSLSKNFLNHFERSWFAEELKDLWLLDLSHNNISSLQPESFTGMNALQRLRLDQNPLMCLGFDYLSPIWINENLNELLFECYSESNDVSNQIY